MKTNMICMSAIAGIVLLSGCAYDGYYDGYYGRYGYNSYPYGYNGYYNRYAYNRGYNGRTRYYTVNGVQYDCLVKYNAAYCT